MYILNRMRKGMTFIEMMTVVLIIGIISGYAFANVGVYAEKARYARAAEDIAMIGTAVAISYLESDESWRGVEAVSTTGKINSFAELFTDDGGNATKNINRKLSKPTDIIKDPWGQPYDLVVKTEDEKKVFYIFCRPGTIAVNSLNTARTDKYNKDRPLGIKVRLN